MRTTLTLDDDVHATVDAMAKSAGKRLGLVVSELLRQRLQSPPSSPGTADDGFDFITFPASGHTIRSADVQRILEEEGV